MRRRMRNFLPIVLIALVVQIFAPIGASWAAGRVLSDPLAASATCASMEAGAPGQSDQSGQHQDRGCCVSCCMSQAVGTTLGTPVAALAEPFRSPRRVVWFEAVRHLTVLQASFHAQARAPPSFS
jgi:hypothetical protein